MCLQKVLDHDKEPSSFSTPNVPVDLPSPNPLDTNPNIFDKNQSYAPLSPLVNGKESALEPDSLLESESVDSGSSTSELIVQNESFSLIEDCKESSDSIRLIPIWIVCPVCKEKHQLSISDAGTLKDDYEIIDRLERTSVKQSLTNKKYQCAQCSSGDEVVKYCPECEEFLCEFCASAHERLSMYKKHQPIPCNDLDSDMYQGTRGTKNCKIHGSNFVFFCNDCQKVLCPICLVKGTVDHRLHDYKTINDSDQMYSDRVHSLKASSSKTLEKYRRYKDYIQRVETEFLSSTHLNILKSAINKRFDAHINALQKKRDTLLERVEEELVVAKKSLWAQKEKVDHTIMVVESAISFAERVSTISNTVERIEMNSQVVERLQSIDSSWNPTPVKPPLVLQEPDNTLELTTLSNANINVEIDDPIVCQHSMVIVKFAISPMSKPLMQILYGKSRQIFDETQVVFYESEEEENCYNLEFVPRVAGKHVIAIELAGVLIAEKTFEVTGTPRYGNDVQCGPDWNGTLPPEQPGKVIAVTNKQRHDVVTVQVTWGNSKHTTHEWGKNGRYEIELLPNM